MPKPLDKKYLQDSSLWMIIAGVLTVVHSGMRSAMGHICGYDAILYDDEALRTVMETATGEDWSHVRPERCREIFIGVQGGNRIQVVSFRFGALDPVFTGWVTAHDAYVRREDAPQREAAKTVVPGAFGKVPAKRTRRAAK